MAIPNNQFHPVLLEHCPSEQARRIANELLETIQNFRDGLFSVLIATRVGEEGLDISEVNHVIFYDNVPSSIRYIQRRGRTGRKDSGKLIVLIAKDTIDETYYWIGKRKMTSAKNMGDKMSKVLQKQVDKPKAALDAYF